MTSRRKPVRAEPWTDPRRTPNLRMVAQWLGSESHRRWEELVRFLEDGYHGYLRPKWRYIQVRRCWERCFEHGRTFCALVPGRGGFMLRVHLPEATGPIVTTGDASDQPADAAAVVQASAGRVTILAVNDDDAVAAARRLLALKRPPRCPSS